MKKGARHFVDRTELRNFSNRWSRRQGWDIVMNQLAVLFADRLQPEVVDGL
jgi:putative transposase